ncbi:iron complex outermembrane receptor protein [Sulfuritortus calidifontis]|uniref:Iron complex outermembrane receptor protein n=1 Tax=Sulfuritortus calidifontis TaxID=1914471 RepID=A0A4R3JZP7_9PROT|nr:TonB-dependent receptor [Sulfuritortus calidifontis]TCS73059.1 iron complex outermembrane receptor protein [Sulfuritortus calidifontis]
MKPGKLSLRLSQAACLLAAAIAAPLCLAEDDRPLSEQIFFEELPVVLTVSRLAQPAREAPAMVTVIDRRMIEASGFTEIPDLMRLVPGFQVAYAANWQPIVTYHGLSDAYSRRMQVLVDGRSIYNPGLGQVEWRELPLAIEDIERIEVVHGPSAAAYGSNAFLATINIVTLQGRDEPGTNLAASRGNRDQSAYLLRHYGSRGDLAWRFSLKDRSDSHFSLQPDKAHDTFLNMRLDYRLNSRDEVMAQFGLNRSYWEMGVRGDIWNPPRTSENDNYAMQLLWRRTLSPDTSYSLQYSRAQKDYQDTWNTTTVLPVLGLTTLALGQSYKVMREQLEFQANTSPADAHRLAYGIEIRHDEIRSPYYFAPGNTLSEQIYRLFGTWEWRPHERWLLNAGGMLEDHYYAGTTLSSRASLHYLPSAHHAFRLGASRGYRSPTFYEQSANQRIVYAPLWEQIRIPAGKLAPEAMTSWELGYVGRYPKQGVNLDLRAFRDSLKDLLDSVKVAYGPDNWDGKAAQGRNKLNAKVWGVEYQLQWQPRADTRFIFGQAWIWQDAEDAVEPGSTDAREMAVSAPRLSYSLLASHEFGRGWLGSFGFYRLGKMTWLAEGDRVPEVQRLDARLAKTWRRAGQRYELALVLQNLSGAYQDFERDTMHALRANRALISLRFWD